MDHNVVRCMDALHDHPRGGSGLQVVGPLFVAEIMVRPIAGKAAIGQDRWGMERVKAPV